MATHLDWKFDKQQLQDFQCTCGDCPLVFPDTALQLIVREVQKHFRKKVVISSGYRCPRRNMEIGGSRKSHHTRAQAIDFTIPDEKLWDIYKWIDKSPYRCGLGIYNSHVHLDSRDGEARWDYRSNAST